MEPIRWDENSPVIVDQTALPQRSVEKRLKTPEDLIASIATLEIRGAPALGLAGAYGVVQALLQAQSSSSTWREPFFEACDRLAKARPTAVNLAWAVNRSLTYLKDFDESEWVDRALQLARSIHHEDQTACRQMARLGASFIEEGGRYLTHCNAGPLATSGVGTALGVFLQAKEDGKTFEVLVDETRPLLQGARLTTFELMEAGIPCRLISDSMAAFAMARLGVQGVFIGADRIAANGDTANKIGSYGLALAAHAHSVPFHVVAPVSTLDLRCSSGEDIPIEERDPGELRHFAGNQTAPEGVSVWNPAFDVVPACWIQDIITEEGVHTFPFQDGPFATAVCE
jgi:methylthioribose-1-phosphate isomerase